MSTLEAVRQFLETHYEDLAQRVGDPAAFRREFTNLQRDWESGDDAAFLLDQTLEIMRKYPSIWAALTAAGLTPGAAEPADITAAPPPTPAGLAAGPTEGATPMRDQTLSRSTLERLAVWDKRLATGKEIVTGCLGVTIVGVTLFIALLAIAFVRDTRTWAAAKDVLLILNGLVGVVLGYYFGRVPGEARADKAESEAKATRSELDRTVTEVRGILEEGGVDTTRGAAEGVALTPTQVERLNRLLRRVGERP